MEVDTGATLSIISHKTYEQLWDRKNAPKITPIKALLKTYTGESIKVLGELNVDVLLDKQQKYLNLLVVDGDGPSLLWRNWLEKVTIDWSQLHQFRTSNDLKDILDRYSSLFSDVLGKVDTVRARGGSRI